MQTRDGIRGPESTQPSAAPPELPGVSSAAFDPDHRAPVAKETPRARRERSKIQFPYGSLNDAIDIAQALGASGETEQTVDELANRLGYLSPSNGSFRLKLSTARTFGVVSLQGHSVRLTDLGARLLDPAQRRQARIEAFLGVPLYRSLFDRFVGQLLPQDVAIEAEMVKLGVAPKQRDKARQAFQRSAQQAGLFFDGRDRLAIPPDLQPRFQKPTPPTEPAKDGGRSAPATGGQPGPTEVVHPAIQGLLHTLPPAGAPWPERQQDQWLAAMKNIFGLIYPADQAE